jgi:hypothetical protein
MTMIRLLAATAATVFAFAAGSARAEMEERVGRVQSRQHQAQGLYGLRRQDHRQAPAVFVVHARRA